MARSAITKKICVITGSRADYGHLSGLIAQIKSDPSLKLQLVVTGSHLEKNFGLTINEIKKDGFAVTEEIKILNTSNDDISIIKSTSQAASLFAEAFKKLKPDCVVLLGDRYEIFAASWSAYLMKIPVCHLHGGESSVGAMDEALRHAISKFSLLHFTATEKYRQRVIQLGEDPQRVFCYGAPGLDQFYTFQFLNREDISKEIQFDLTSPLALVTYHPVTLEAILPQTQIQNLLDALKGFNLKVVFTKANADSGGAVINQIIEQFSHWTPQQYKLIDNLGNQKYYSLLKIANVVIGNSSSGIIEAASFKCPVVNIGSRQEGRVKAENIIDTGYSVKEISAGIRLALSKDFLQKIKNVKNPYVKFTDGKTSYRIKEKIKEFVLKGIDLKKNFFDIDFDEG